MVLRFRRGGCPRRSGAREVRRRRRGALGRRKRPRPRASPQHPPAPARRCAGCRVRLHVRAPPVCGSVRARVCRVRLHVRVRSFYSWHTTAHARTQQWGRRSVRARGCLKKQHNLCEADTNSRGAVLAAPRLRVLPERAPEQKKEQRLVITQSPCPPVCGPPCVPPAPGRGGRSVFGKSF